ncbi:hypothetical protein SS50377_21461 [Spironucleus salmonicida]|uniref:Uncharacterized protein n=1 Tax=Spironucleus salmonicida TaxID=348837 RepID=V6LD65_9EUKA|nr:hypothetical protein SS50377_21461 [Spironucleus salmonicida]|eukprot:EST42417.1 Hypothetical protein SS50377_17972 [Spironucleus salmonicida]
MQPQQPIPAMQAMPMYNPYMYMMQPQMVPQQIEKTQEIVKCECICETCKCEVVKAELVLEINTKVTEMKKLAFDTQKQAWTAYGKAMGFI